MNYRDIHTRVEQLIRTASCHYEMPFPPPQVLVDLLGADAGQAWPEKNLLRFNPEFYRRNQNHFVQHVVGHEVAHLVAPKVYGRRIRAHGREWQDVMSRVFKLPAERCHNYDLTESTRYRFIYGCNCPDKEIPLSAIRHNRARRGVRYYCRGCSSRLQFLYESTPNNKGEKLTALK